MFYFDFPIQLQAFLNQYWLTINYLLIFLLLLLIYITYKKPVLAAGIIIILLPTYLFRTKIFGLPVTYLEMCLGVFFATWSIQVIILSRRRAEKAFNDVHSILNALKIPLTLLLLAATISVFISNNTIAALGLWKAYFIEPILFFIILLMIIKTPKDKEIILWSLGISTLSIALYSIFQKFTGFGIAEPHWVAASSRRVTAFFTSPNAVGLYLGPIAVLYFGWILVEVRKKISFEYPKLIFFLTKVTLLIFMLLAIIFTKSHGTWLGLLATLIFLGFSVGNKKWTTILVALTILAVLTIPTIQQTALPIITFSDAAGQNRIALWQGSWQYLTSSFKNFILGAGIFGFPAIHQQFRNSLKIEPLIYPHNIILNFWLDIGLFGLIAITWIIILFFKTGVKKHQPVILASMIIILVHGLVDVPYFKNDLSILFWVITSLVFINHSMEDQQLPALKH
jgi:O-antigen ligase